MQIGRFGAALLSLSLVGAVWAATPTPSPEQIEQFKRLPPAQQREIAAKFGVDPAILSSMGQAPVTAMPQPEVVVPKDVTPAPAAMAEPEPEEGQPLKRFGYDLFAGSPTTFAPVTEVPIPAEYVLGPGDMLQVQLFGARNENLQLQVNRDGRISFPGLGPINVAGMSFEAASESLLKRISQQLIGVQASISMGELRSMRIFVLGDANRPGAYTISSLSTMTNALFVSGGVKEIGSLRQIQLKRNGRLIGVLDLYDLLLKGDTSKDMRLQPGDVIFIPPVAATAAITGKVRRPAIYELRAGDTVAALLQMAGGLEADAYSSISVLERITAQRVRTVRDLNLNDRQALNLTLLDGDVIDVKSLGARLDQNIELVGALERPGKYEWRSGQRIADLIRNPRADLLEETDLNYALVVRERNIRGDIDILQFDLGAAISNPRSSDNLLLKPRDKVVVFTKPLPLSDLQSSTDSEAATEEKGAGTAKSLAAQISKARLRAAERAELLNSLLRQLRQQGRYGEPVATVRVDGEVHFPGEYPLPSNGSAMDLIKAAGGLKESAYASTVEVSRTNTAEGNEASIEHLSLNLQDAQMTQAFRLKGRDRLMVRQIPEWSELLKIELKGEVRHPGVYTFRRGETLAQVIQRAGGLTAYAYPRGAVFTRKELREQEQQRLAEFEAKLNAELASQALTAEGAKDRSLDAAKLMQLTQMLEKVRGTRAMGRVVVDLPMIIRSPEDLDVVLEDGDVLAIPRQQQAVTVIGEVQHPTSHFYSDALSMKDYLSQSGGYSARADDERIYVIQANGAVKMPPRLLWFHGDIRKLEPGDTIVAPLDTTYLSPLSMWSQITQIIYNSAVAVAAIASL